jgi:hypothetical protein
LTRNGLFLANHKPGAGSAASAQKEKGRRIAPAALR